MKTLIVRIDKDFCGTYRARVITHGNFYGISVIGISQQDIFASLAEELQKAGFSGKLCKE